LLRKNRFSPLSGDDEFNFSGGKKQRKSAKRTQKEAAIRYKRGPKTHHPEKLLELRPFFIGWGKTAGFLLQSSKLKKLKCGHWKGQCHTITAGKYSGSLEMQFMIF
jgi:hypothetical protein